MITATVEIGHTYAPDRLIKFANSAGHGDVYSSELGRHFMDSVEAGRLRKIAEYFGESATRVALVDDVTAREAQKRSPENAWRWQHFLNATDASVSLGAGVDLHNLYHESDFEPAGRDIVTQVQSLDLPEGYRLSRDGRKLKLPKDALPASKTISLQGFNGVEDPTYPSCEVLDVAWLQKRLSIAHEAVTVLPSNMAEQQARVSTLADLVGINRTPHTVALYD